MRLPVAAQWIDPQSVLDVGAHRGEWTAEARLTWPLARYLLIEANGACVGYLRDSGERWKLALLSDLPKPATFWLPKVGSDTGASMYRECTPYYRDDACYQESRLTTTLDKVVAGETFDLIKLDVQGAELDVLRGGPVTLAAAKALIVEVSLVRYNDQAPLADEVDRFLALEGFVSVATLGESRGRLAADGMVIPGDERVIQRDLLYLRNQLIPGRYWQSQHHPHQHQARRKYRRRR